MKPPKEKKVPSGYIFRKTFTDRRGVLHRHPTGVYRIPIYGTYNGPRGYDDDDIYHLFFGPPKN